jgi:hypothetical protein
MLIGTAFSPQVEEEVLTFGEPFKLIRTEVQSWGCGEYCRLLQYGFPLHGQQDPS